MSNAVAVLRGVSSLLGLMLLLTNCASRTVGPPSLRFGALHDLLVLPPDSLAPVTIQHAAPRYPPDARTRGETVTLVAAFVIDTGGLVEHRTVSFLKSAASPFVRSVCEALSHTRFTPTRVDGRPRRALVLASFAFEITPTLPPAPPPPLGSLREQLRRVPTDSVMARLEGAPHCP